MTDPTSLAAVLAGSDVYRRGPVELRLGDYREVLADVEPDAVIADPPFGDRTHDGQRHGRREARYTADKSTVCLAHRGLGYGSWSHDDVRDFVDSWAPRAAAWICALTSHDLVPIYAEAAEAHGRYVFAPISCVQHARNVRLAGDGPANWTDHLVVSRPRSLRKWGALPGAYVGKSHDVGENSLDRSKRIPGGKPLWLMSWIVRDYSRPGNLVCDPCAGGGTTLLAAALEGRHAIGAELDPETFKKACKRLDAEAGRIATAQLRWQGPERKRKPKQAGLCFDTPEAAE